MARLFLFFSCFLAALSAHAADHAMLRAAGSTKGKILCHQAAKGKVYQIDVSDPSAMTIQQVQPTAGRVHKVLHGLDAKGRTLWTLSGGQSLECDPGKRTFSDMEQAYKKAAGGGGAKGGGALKPAAASTGFTFLARAFNSHFKCILPTRSDLDAPDGCKARVVKSWEDSFKRGVVLAAALKFGKDSSTAAPVDELAPAGSGFTRFDSICSPGGGKHPDVVSLVWKSDLFRLAKGMPKQQTYCGDHDSYAYAIAHLDVHPTPAAHTQCKQICAVGVHIPHSDGAWTDTFLDHIEQHCPGKLATPCFVILGDFNHKQKWIERILSAKTGSGNLPEVSGDKATCCWQDHFRNRFDHIAVGHGAHMQISTDSRNPENAWVDADSGTVMREMRQKYFPNDTGGPSNFMHKPLEYVVQLPA